MSLIDFTYSLGEICLYYAVLGPVFMIFGCNGTYFPQAAAFLITEVACAAGSRFKSPLRFLPLLLLIFALLIGHSIGLAMLGVIPAIVIILRTKAGNFEADNDSIHNIFIPSIVIYAMIIIFGLISGKTAVLVQSSVPYYITWLLCAVFCMRLLRIPANETGHRYRVMNLTLLVLIALTGLILSSRPVTAVSAAALRAVYLYFIAPLLFAAMCIIAAIPAVIFYGIFKLVSILGRQNTAQADEQLISEIQQTLEETGADALITPQWLTRCAAAIGILLFLLISYIIARRLVSSRRRFPPSGSYLRREAIRRPEDDKRRRRLFASGTEDEIRKCYKKYLSLCRRYNVPADGTLASDALLQQAAPYTGISNASELRRLWLPVRYGNVSSSPEDIRKAQTVLSSIRSEAADIDKALSKQNT